MIGTTLYLHQFHDCIQIVLVPDSLDTDGIIDLAFAVLFFQFLHWDGKERLKGMRIEFNLRI